MLACVCMAVALSVSLSCNAAMSETSNHSRKPSGTSTMRDSAAHAERQSGRTTVSANARMACRYIDQAAESWPCLSPATTAGTPMATAMRFSPAAMISSNCASENFDPTIMGSAPSSSTSVPPALAGPECRAATESRIRLRCSGASLLAYLMIRFGVAAFLKNRSRCSVMARSALISRTAGVSALMPRQLARGSGIGAQWATSSTS